MKIFNKFLFVMMCVFCFVLSVGCKNDIVAPIEENPSTDVPVTTDPSNNVNFVNNTTFVVKIFTDSSKNNLLGELYPDGEFSCYICPAEHGNVFYYTYYFLLEDILIPYGEFIDNYDLVQKQFFSIDIQNPKTLFTNSKNIVILENDSKSTISLYNGSIESIPENKKLVLQNPNGLLNPTEYGIYMSTGSDYTIDSVTNPIIFSLDEKKGYIYSYIYTENDDNSLVLKSKIPFNLSLQNKVWKNSLSKTYGKDLVAGCIATRENPEDGYMLFGSLSASYINDNIEGNVPYYAFINTEGNLTKEYSLTFRDSQKSTVFYHCIEKNGIWLAVGKNRYEDNSESLFVAGEQNGRTFYQKIPSPAKDSEQEQSDEISVTSNYKACGITYVEDKTFCVLLGYEDDKNGKKAGGFELLEITIDGLNEVKISIVYKTSEDDKNNNVIPCSILYNKDNYIVLSQNSLFEDSTISVIDKNTDILKCNNRTLNSCSLNKMKIYSIKSEEYFFLSGSYVDAMSGRDIATFGKIKIDDINNFSENSEIDTSNFKMFTGSNNLLNSNFDDFVVDNKGNIILGGFSCADYDYEHRSQYDMVTKNAVPFVVSYDLDQNKTNWEKEYTDQKGYVVYSVEKSSIDSLFLDLWNPSTRHSYIVSTGLLGEIPEKIKSTLGQGSFIKDVKGAEISVKFYENSNSQTAYTQDVFQLGKEYALDDLKKYEPSDVCKVTGWYVLAKGNSTINRNSSVYKPFYLSSPLYVYPMGTPSVKDEDSSVEDDTVVEGEELVFPIKFTDYKITEIILYPKYEHSFSYDENYHWCICGESKSQHTFTDWQITVQPTETTKGEKCRFCTVCDFKESK